MAFIFFSKKSFFGLVGGTLIVVTVSSTLYFYQQYRQMQQRLQNPQEVAREEVKAVVVKVDKIILLPIGEEPTLATVTDIEKLQSQAFFANAQNGDKVLVYTNAKKAVLYRPSLNKIIEVGPISISSIATSSANQTIAKLNQEAGQINFFLLNGTTIIGLTKKYETELKTKVPGAVVVDRDNAKKRDYDKTIIVDLVGTKTSEVQQLATGLGITVSKLPSGETTPSRTAGSGQAADFLIILGSDKALTPQTTPSATP